MLITADMNGTASPTSNYTSFLPESLSNAIFGPPPSEPAPPPPTDESDGSAPASRGDSGDSGCLVIPSAGSGQQPRVLACYLPNGVFMKNTFEDHLHRCLNSAEPKRADRPQPKKLPMQQAPALPALPMMATPSSPLGPTPRAYKKQLPSMIQSLVIQESLAENNTVSSKSGDDASNSPRRNRNTDCEGEEEERQVFQNGDGRSPLTELSGRFQKDVFVKNTFLDCPAERRSSSLEEFVKKNGRGGVQSAPCSFDEVENKKPEQKNFETPEKKTKGEKAKPWWADPETGGALPRGYFARCAAAAERQNSIIEESTASAEAGKAEQTEEMKNVISGAEWGEHQPFFFSAGSAAPRMQSSTDSCPQYVQDAFVATPVFSERQHSFALDAPHEEPQMQNQQPLGVFGGVGQRAEKPSDWGELPEGIVVKKTFIDCPLPRLSSSMDEFGASGPGWKSCPVSRMQSVDGTAMPAALGGGSFPAARFSAGQLEADMIAEAFEPVSSSSNGSDAGADADMLGEFEQQQPFEGVPSSAPPRQRPTPAFSVGSIPHQMGQPCKPCGFVHKLEGCENGAECRYCHLCPPGSIRQRKKVKKVMIRQIRHQNYVAAAVAREQQYYADCAFMQQQQQQQYYGGGGVCY